MAISLTPIVAVALGALVLGEPVTWNLFAGAGCSGTLGGFIFSIGRRGSRPRVEPGVEDPQRPVPVGSGGRLPAGEEPAEVGLDVVAAGAGQLAPLSSRKVASWVTAAM